MKRFLLTLMTFLLFPLILLANDSRVLIINSSAEVLKYRQMSRRLESRFADNVQFDLNEKRVNKSVLENKVIDYDPDVIVTIGSEAAAAASRVAPDKPRLFLQTLEVKSSDATHNLFGIRNSVSVGYQLSSFRYFFPSIKTVAVFYNPEFNDATIDRAKKAAKRANIILKAIPVRSEAQFKSYLRDDLMLTDSIWVIPDPVVLSSIDTVRALFDFADENRLPVLGYDSSLIKYGASLVVSVEDRTVVNQAIQMTKQIVDQDYRGAQIKDPAGTHVIMNLRQVRRLGISYNEYSLSSVNEVIE